MKLIKPNPIQNELGRYNPSTILKEAPALVASMVKQGLMSYPSPKPPYEIPHTKKNWQTDELEKLPNPQD